MTSNKKHRTPGSFFTNNTALKIISLVFAIILWSFVTNSTNPDRTKTLDNIPVVIQGLEALEEKGLTIREDLEKALPTVSIKVNVKNSDYRLVTKNVVFASIDVSEITKDGANSITVMPTFANLANVSIESVEPQAINLTVDKIVDKEVPVVIEKTGELKEGLVSVAPEYTQSILLKGSSYYLDRIENAVADVELSKLNDGDKLSVICRYEDKDGNAVNFSGKKIDIDMDIQTKKEVSVNASESVINSDALQQGYQFVSISTGKIILCGHSENISKITEVKTAEIDLKGKDSTFTSTPVELILPEGITVLSGQENPVAKIEITQTKETVTVTRHITVSGLQSGLNASITSGDQTVQIQGDGTAQITATVSLTGPKLLLEGITEADVIVRLSLLDKGAGTYELSPVVGLSPAFANTVSAQLVSPAQVSVSVSVIQ